MTTLTWVPIGCLLVAIGWTTCAHAQLPQSLPEGFNRIDAGKHVTIITDLPLDQDIQQLPELFDQAMREWGRVFDSTPRQYEAWHATMFLMLDRQRFEQAGLIPPEIPRFQHGWQKGDTIWVNEQPSPYYRRHLMLHEGTHWFMFRKYGKYHAPWLMEGIAEWLGTHRLEETQLQMGIIPHDNLEVPFWGRISLIRQQIGGGVAPTMEEIWRYSDTAHQRVDAYAWSWAMVLFLNEHPDTSKMMAALLRQPAMDSAGIERWLRSRVQHKLPRLRAEWMAFISDLDYGFTSQPGLLRLSDKTRPLQSQATIEIEAARGWQATGMTVEPGQKLEITSEGEYVVASEARPWICQPEGVTLEYYRGQPLGKLMMTIVGPIDREPNATESMEIIPIGQQAKFTVARAGEIFFRINETIGKLLDNTGSLTIQTRIVE